MILNRIKETAERFPDHVAVRMKSGDTYRQYTYRELLKGIASASQSLAGLGIAKGDRIALLSENRPEWMIAYLSVVSLGAVIVPLDAQLTDKEVALLLGDSGARAVFVSAETRPKLPQGTAVRIINFDPDGEPRFSELLEAHPAAALAPAPDAGELAALLYTSGTTGDPKGVMLSHGNLASNCESCIKLDIVRPDDNMLLLLPLHHTYPAMTCMLLPLSMGAAVTVLNSLKGPDILVCMRETGVSIMLGVPKLLSGLRRAIMDGVRKKPAPVRMIVKLLLAANGLLRKTAGVNMGKAAFGKVHEMFGPALRLFASGGARLEPDVYSDLTRLGFTVIEGYGLTETSPVNTFNPLSRQKAGSIGIPLPDVEVRIANPDENGQGELAIRGPNVMLGYYHKPRETAEALKDGWFHSGDLGYRDGDGYLYVTGRAKEMIVLSTGKKIFPDELEEFYRQIPSIREICIIQRERGIEAAVVPDFDYLRKKGASNSRETIALAIEDLAKNLPPYKRISGLKVFKDPFPVTRLEKLRRAKVREMYDRREEEADVAVREVDAGLLEDPVMKKLLSCLEPFSAKKKIMPNDNLELDLGLDSLGRVELGVSIEKTFGIGLPDAFVAEVVTVQDAFSKIRELLASGAGAAGTSDRMSWADILATDPSEELKKTLRLETGALWGAAMYPFTLALRAFFLLCGRLSVSGAENLPAQGPFIIAPNHVSVADAPAVMCGLAWKVTSRTFFLGTTDYFGGPLKSRIARLIHVIPVDMEARLTSAMQLSAYVLRQGKVLCVFPEGSRSRDGRLREFKKGVGIIAKELNVPIVPAATRGIFEMMPTGRKFPRPAKISVTFGRPVYPDGRDYDAIVKELHGEVVKLLEFRDSGG